MIDPSPVGESVAPSYFPTVPRLGGLTSGGGRPNMCKTGWGLRADWATARESRPVFFSPAGSPPQPSNCSLSITSVHCSTPDGFRAAHWLESPHATGHRTIVARDPRDPRPRAGVLPVRGRDPRLRRPDRSLRHRPRVRRLRGRSGPRRAGPFAASCTCPYVDEYGAVCKHIWATVLAAEARGFAAGAAAAGRLRLVLDEDDGLRRRHRTSAPPVRSRPRPSALDAEARDLEGPTRRPPPGSPARRCHGTAGPMSAERQLVFVVDVAASEQARKLVLEVNVQERKKNGEWGKPKAQYLAPAQIDGLPDPLDRQLLALLGGAERGDSYGLRYGTPTTATVSAATASPGRSSIPSCRCSPRTGRVRLRRDPNPPVRPGRPRPRPRPAVGTGRRRHPRRRREALGALGEPAPRRRDAAAVGAGAGRPGAGGLGRPVRPARRRRRVRLGADPAPGRDDRRPRLPRPTNCSASCSRCPACPRLDLPEELRYTEEAVPPRPRLVVKAAKHHYGPPVLHAELSFDYDGAVRPRAVARPRRLPARRQAVLRSATRPRSRPRRRS